MSIVDGSLQEFYESDSFVRKLRKFEREGYQGKMLVHELISDDWGAPPVYFQVTGVAENGGRIDERIG